MPFRKSCSQYLLSLESQQVDMSGPAYHRHPWLPSALLHGRAAASSKMSMVSVAAAPPNRVYEASVASCGSEARLEPVIGPPMSRQQIVGMLLIVTVNCYL